MRKLMADYANECTHSFAQLLGHLAIAVGRVGDFLAFSLCEKKFLCFSVFSHFFSPRYVRKFFSISHSFSLREKFFLAFSLCDNFFLT